jgi:cold shock CspA family protein/ribosome-associated translation inhibitor RaiA
MRGRKRESKRMARPSLEIGPPVPSVEIASRGATVSPRECRRIRERARRLARFAPRITAIRVVVTAPHRRLHGEVVRYAVRIHLAVPRGTIVIRRQSESDLVTAVQRSFEAARRRLQDYVREREPAKGAPSRMAVGRVARLNRWEGFGFLAANGREIYFHRNSVLGGAFDSLEVGSPVRFVEEQGTEGPQASTVIAAGGRAY